MKKIPTLFEREFENHKVVKVLNKVTPGMEWVLEGEGDATIKLDGSCCAIIKGMFYKRYDAKKGKTPPEGAIPCCDPDPITGHWPHWVKIDKDNPSDKWFIFAYENTWMNAFPEDGTYEAVGPHFNGNPEHWTTDQLVRHGSFILKTYPRDFEGIKEALFNGRVEGIVFWKDGEPKCKIKRSDFGFEWPIKE